MAFTTGNDINILQGSDLGTVGAGAGNDRYVLTAATLNANQQITISDTLGTNTLQLVGGLEIVSSKVSADAVQLTLNNGAVITVLGASTFTFLTGGDSLAGTGGLSQNYSDFAAQSLGVAVPAVGAAPVTGNAATVNTNGGTTAGPVVPPAATYTLTASSTNLVAEGQAVSFTVTPSAAAAADVTLYVQLTGATVGAITSQAAAADFSAVLLPITIPAGSTAAVSASATVVADGVTEGPEGFQAKLLDSGFAVVSGVNAITGTITEAVSAGQAFTLTTSSDNFTGTAGNDTFNGSVSATAADNTLTLTDLINGGAGTDTLNVTAAVANTNIAVPSAGMQNIETVNIRALDADGTVGTDAATFAAVAGVTAVNADRSTSNVTVTGLANGASVGMIGDGTVSNGILKYAYATATADQVINISGSTSNAGVADITATASAGVTKATINSTGAANKVDTIKLDSASSNTVTSLTVNAATNLTATLTGADFATTSALTVAGAAASVDLGTAANFKTIDASGMTAGGLTIALGTNTTSFKGGQGNDVVTAAAVAATTAGAVDAGAGTDTLIVNNSTLVDTAAEAGVYANFETLQTVDRATGSNTTADTYDMSLLSGITALKLGAMDDAADDQTFNKMTATQAGAVTITGDNTLNDLTFALATATGTSDVLSLSLASATSTANVDVSLLTMTGFETLNVSATTGTAGTSSDVAFKASGADKLTAVNLSGTADVSFSGTNTSKAITLVSTTTGAAAISGNFVNGSSITTGSGKDTLTMGTGFGTYNAGANDDTINATAVQLNTGADYNVINGGDGTDTLNITGGGSLTIVDNNLSKITNVEKIVVATTTTNDQSITTGGWFDAAFKANGVNLTTTSSTGNITIDMTSFTGAATVSATSVGTAGGQGALSIQTGSGADTITVSAATAGDAGTVKTFDGNDKITTASTEAFDLTGGKGNDTLVLGSTGIETINFESTAANNGTDTITGFEFGASKDILQFKNFVGAAEAETLGTTIAASVDASAKNVVTLTDIQDLTASNFGGTAATSVIKTAASQNLVVIADKSGDVDAIQNIYYVTTDASNVATVTLVGTINEGTFHTDNIITA